MPQSLRPSFPASFQLKEQATDQIECDYADQSLYRAGSRASRALIKPGQPLSLPRPVVMKTCSTGLLVVVDVVVAFATAEIGLAGGGGLESFTRASHTRPNFRASRFICVLFKIIFIFSIILLISPHLLSYCLLKKEFAQSLIARLHPSPPLELLPHPPPPSTHAQPALALFHLLRQN